MRSSGSIGSYGNHRRLSGPIPSTGSKGIMVSTSRTGAARSAAILLIGSHISAINKSKSSNQSEASSLGGASSCDSENMNRYIHKQLNQQRHLLSLELSPCKSNKKIRSMLGMNGFDSSKSKSKSNEEELNSYGSIHIGALPTPACDTAKFAVNLFFIQIYL